MNNSVPLFHYYPADILYTGLQPASLLDHNMDQHAIYLTMKAMKQPISSISKKKEWVSDARNYSTSLWVQSDAKPQTSGNLKKVLVGVIAIYKTSR